MLALEHAILCNESHFSDQLGEVRSNSRLGVLESSQTFLQAHSNRVQVLDILSPEINGKWHLFAHDLKLVELVWQVQKLLVEIKVEGVPIDSLLNVEDVFGFLLGSIDVLDIVDPLLKIVSLTSNEGVLKAVTHLLETPSLMQVLPVGTQHILHSLHVECQFPFDLLRPDDLVRNVWEASDLVQHG